MKVKRTSKPLLIILSVFLSSFLCTILPCFSKGLKPFTTDGCSSFPDGTIVNKELWHQCCIEHDKSYWLGGTYEERLKADKKLRQCVADLGEPAVGLLMLHGVRIGGSPFWPTGFRWGYGWPYPRGYQKITGKERIEAEKMIKFETKIDKNYKKNVHFNVEN